MFNHLSLADVNAALANTANAALLDFAELKGDFVLNMVWDGGILAGYAFPEGLPKGTPITTMQINSRNPRQTPYRVWIVGANKALGEVYARIQIWDEEPIGAGQTQAITDWETRRWVCKTLTEVIISDGSIPVTDNNVLIQVRDGWLNGRP